MSENETPKAAAAETTPVARTRSPKSFPGHPEYKAPSQAPYTEVTLENGSVIRIDGKGRRICGAKRRDGGLCRGAAVGGLTHCRIHAGKSRTGRNAARLRLAELAQPAIAQTARLMTSADSETVRLNAASSILDRAGFGRQQVIEEADARDLIYQRLLAAAGEDAPFVDEEMADVAAALVDAGASVGDPADDADQGEE